MENINEHHNIWPILSDILIILALSGIIVPVLQRLRVSPVIGYLFCGLLIGPYALGHLAQDYPILENFSISENKFIPILAELGVVFLLFMIGLELTLSRLWELRKYVLGLGLLQIVITGGAIFAIANLFDNSLATSILIGAAFSLSSTAVVMQLLSEWHLISRPVGRVCFSVLLMQDLAVVPILVMVGVLSGTDGPITGYEAVLFAVLKALLLAIVVVGAIFIIGKLLFRPTLRLLSPSKNVEWLLSIILFVVIGSAILTHHAGLSAALGAFLAGLLLAETEYRHEIEVIIEPLKGILMGIFFLSVGLFTNLTAFVENPYWIIASVLGIFVLKALIFYPIARGFSISHDKALRSSILLAQCGEFAFIVIGLSSIGGLMPADDAQFFLLVATFSLLLSPFTMRLSFLIDKYRRDAEDDSPTEMVTEERQVIIAGFGRVGLTLANILEDQKIPYVAIDNDGANIAKYRAEGYPVLRGDARNIGLWQKLGVESAKAAVITINDYGAAKHILEQINQKWPLLPVIIRTRDTNRIERYYESGASAVVPETLESSLQLVKTLLVETGVKSEEADNIIDKHRAEALAGEKPDYVQEEQLAGQ